jgi:hypothetical protein
VRRVQFTPTVAHCSMATLIGLSIRVKLMRCLPSRFKLDIMVRPPVLSRGGICEMCEVPAPAALPLQGGHHGAPPLLSGGRDAWTHHSQGTVRSCVL